MRDTLYQRIIHILTLVVLLAIWVSIPLCWGSLPEQIPIHFDFAGNANGWGGRASILLMPAIITVTTVIMFVVERFPQTWNTGVKVTPLNQAFVYRTCKDMLVTLELTIALSMAIPHVYTLSSAAMPIWVAPVMLVLILGPMVYFLIRLSVGSRKFKI